MNGVEADDKRTRCETCGKATARCHCAEDLSFDDDDDDDEYGEVVE